ncbi:hypothetical protein [Pseudonocardia sp. HH130630-07]|uniref:hypothetical protein n=1 Tax=Pseudonocardia sp. HH130630-07 TaxID=1690815 RepID=UPI0008153C8B|nr:hypothetical protein [Pseudonocardia sp. HH130630-07]ANY10625.1 hypothetical protein AFB00_29915 [Pseudonocardia sp. HH130630-07]
MSGDRISVEDLLGLVPAAREVDETAGTSAADLVGLSMRHADDLARIVEAAIAEQNLQHDAEVASLRRRHRRRIKGLQLLADALGEQHAQLDEAEHQVRRQETEHQVRRERQDRPTAESTEQED